jgi:polysaccharide biosynthesis protein PelA
MRMRTLYQRNPLKRTLFLLLSLLAITAGNRPLYGAPFQRIVLGLYNSEDGQTLIDNNLRYDVEMVLNYLGLKLEYHDVAQGLPAPVQMKKYRGIVAWFESNRMRDAAAFWPWLADQLQADRKVVLLNGSGPRFDSTTGKMISLETVNRTLGLMGMVLGDQSSNRAMDIQVVGKNPEMVEFERALTHEHAAFSQAQSIDKANQVFLKLQRKSTGAISDAVVLTPSGGIVLESYVRYMNRQNFKRQWRINPFLFFSAALGVVDSPRPDCTTVNGARLFYSHIDGDGFRNLSRVERGEMSSEILYDNILTAYPDLPFTVSVIVAEIDKAVFGSERTIGIARKIFSLPNVEAASHTFAHPLVWNTSLISTQQVTEYTEIIDGANISNQVILPWKIPGYTYDPEKEMVYSCRYIEKELLSGGKKCGVLLWSGNCLPDERALDVCTNAGILNMNGGDSRFDAVYPSYLNLYPLYRQVGDYYQIHSSGSNENTYTHLWTRDFGGYQNVIQTFQKTEIPRRVAPVNVYYHFYSGERHASLLALKKMYDWVQTQQLFPVFASRYISIVNGFISCDIDDLGEGRWRISNSGTCRTIRFDQCDQYPDLERSPGILGFRHSQGSLYLFLDQSSETLIQLTDTPPDKPYLSSATADVNSLNLDDRGGLHFQTAAFGRASFNWNNLVHDKDYTVTLRSGDRTDKIVGHTDINGTLQISMDMNTTTEIYLEPVDTGVGLR